jgi:hypothetical protein
MIYVFEGSRNSGKTYLSTEISKLVGIPRFQFDFGSYFNLLGLSSKDNREAHSFSMGKELMLMQMAKDINLPDFIHDRGILTVLAWGISENRISKSDAAKQILYIKNSGLMSGITVLYIDGDNPNKSDRNKDQWDYADKSSAERKAFEFVISKFNEIGIGNLKVFKNTFDTKTVLELKSFFESEFTI